MTVVQPRYRALVCGLELVVKLFGDPVAHLVGERLDVELGREPAHQAYDHAEIPEVCAHRSRSARVLNLDGDRAAVMRRRPIDLTDRRSSDRFGIELGERLLEWR